MSNCRRGITATADPAKAAAGADFAVLAVPSQKLRANLGAWASVIGADTVLVSFMKGVELGTAKLMSEVIAEVAGAGPERIAVVSGPNLAGEIVRRQPAASVVACKDEAVAKRLQAACHTAYYRPYTNVDVVRCEIGGAVRTSAWPAWGTTCSSPLSRNNIFGANLGRGMTLQETIAATKQTAEGVTSCESVLDLARRHGIDMPITEMVFDIVHDGKPPQVAVKELMSRSAKPERR